MSIDSGDDKLNIIRITKTQLLYFHEDIVTDMIPWSRITEQRYKVTTIATTSDNKYNSMMTV